MFKLLALLSGDITGFHKGDDKVRDIGGGGSTGSPFQFQNNYLADKVKEYETTNKELREEAVKKTELLEEVEEKDKVYALLRVFTLWLFILYVF